MHRIIKLILVFTVFFSFSFSLQAAVLPNPLKSVQKINLNTANPQSLVGIIKGIGKKRAQSIVLYRTEHGPFKTVSDLSKVKGLGRNFVNHHLNELERVFSVD